jgi:hypothetical protein
MYSSASPWIRVQIGEAFAQHRHEAQVHLNGENFPAAFQQKFGQRAQSRADFQNLVGLGHRARIRDALQLVLVVQEVLPE